MPVFGNSFLYDTFVGVYQNLSVYRGITFGEKDYDEAQVDLKTGRITFYMDTSPEPRDHWKC